MNREEVSINNTEKDLFVADLPLLSRDLQEEVELKMQRKCKRCGNFYSNGSNAVCSFHTGVFVDPDSTSLKAGAVTGWTCCSTEEVVRMPAMMAAMAYMPGCTEMVFLSKASQKRDCPGCTQAPRHEEDENYAKSVSSFPLDLDAMRRAYSAEKARQYEAAMQVTAGAPEPQRDEQTEVVDGCAIHNVQKSDTLVGISMRYNVPVPMIRKANPNMVGDVLHMKQLRVPVVPGFRAKREANNDESRKAAVIGEFEKKTGCARAEAVFYCKDAEFNLKAALEAFNEDTQYATRHSPSRLGM